MKKISWDFSLPLYLTEDAREKRCGLLGQENIHYALLIPRCPLVHTFFMKESIDIVFLNRGKIKRIYKEVEPGRLRGAWASDCLELPGGAAERLGLRLEERIAFSL